MQQNSEDNQDSGMPTWYADKVADWECRHGMPHIRFLCQGSLPKKMAQTHKSYGKLNKFAQKQLLVDAIDSCYMKLGQFRLAASNLELYKQ